MEKEFAEILEQLIVYNRQLLSLFQQERDCLVRNDIDGLKHVNTSEIRLGGDISDVEKRREKMIQEFKVAFDIKNDPVHIKDIIEKVEEPYQTLFTQKAKQLKGLLLEIMKVRNLNNRVIEKMLQFNERNVKLFMNMGNKNLNYDEKGKMNHSNKQALNTVV